MSNKYIVRQPIKDAQGKIWGHEILYHGENQALPVTWPLRTNTPPRTRFIAS